MKTYSILISTVLFTGCISALYPGGGGGQYNPPRMVINNLLITKSEIIQDDVLLDEYRNSNFHRVSAPIEGYLKKSKTNVTISIQQNYPQTSVFCKNSSGKILWSVSQAHPFNTVNGVEFVQNLQETEIYILWGNNNQFITIYNEQGVQKKKINLGSNKSFNITYSHPTSFRFLNKKHLALQSNNHISLFDLKGNLIKVIKLPRYPTGLVAKEIYNSKGDAFLVIYAEQQATSHSSTLFILSPTLEIIYKEYLLGAEWIKFPNDGKKNYFILLTESKWRPNKTWIRVGGPWKYTIN